MSDEKQLKTVAGASLPVEEILKLMNAMSDKQMAQMEKTITIMASKIVHPDPTPEDRERTLKALAQRAEEARANEAMKAHKRKYCTGPATSDLPHRRPLNEVGNFRGMTMVAWAFTQRTRRLPNGQSELCSPSLQGVCQWCQTEWNEESPDYLEALSWGSPNQHGTYSMNAMNGNWLGG